MAFLDETGLAEVWKIIGEKYGQYNEHFWAIQHGVGGSGYREVKTPLTNNYTLHETESIYGMGGTFIKQYASEVEFDANGNPSLKNPTSWTRSAPQSYSACEEYAKAILALAPCYISVERSDFSGNKDICYIPENATCTYNGNGTIWWNNFPLDGDGDGYEESEGYVVSLHRGSDAGVPALLVTGEYYELPPGEIVYEHSPDRNAYPDDEIVDDTKYKYLGIPFEKLPMTGRVETGSYVGTGTYGSGNPTALTFSFVPRFVKIIDETSSDANRLRFDWIEGQPRVDPLINNGNYTMIVNLNGATLSFATSKGAQYQFNASGATYRYIAIG